MKFGQFNISETFLYRYRYWIGYGALVVGLVTVLILTGLYLPGGLSNAEMKSAIHSSAISSKNFWAGDVVDLPYDLLQKASMAILHVSTLTVKLPSLILAFISAIGLSLILRNWFKPSVAILGSLIAITTGRFLFIAQNGTPDIMLMFWPIMLILTASMVPAERKFQKLYVAMFFLAAALSLYTPLSVYIILIIAGAIILHPHLRYILKQLSKLEIFLGIVVILIIVAPLILNAIHDPHMILTLLGAPPSSQNYNANLSQLAGQYFGFASRPGQVAITPFFELGSLLLILLGIYYVLENRATAKSYVIILWTLALIPIVIINPNLTTITFLPLVILLAAGLNGLLGHWYGLFPRNPYARVGGLIPVVILVSVLVLSGISRYINEYLYDPNIVNSFSVDVGLIPKGTKNIVIDTKENDFYQVIAKYNHVNISSAAPTTDRYLQTRESKNTATFGGYKLIQIITSSRKENSDRFYLYQKTTD